MNRIFIMTVFLFLLGSCRDTLEFVDQKGSAWIKGNPAEITSVQEGIWKVGKNRGKIVSKSVSFHVDTPVLKEADALELSRKYGINSWLFRVRRLGKAQEDVGYFYIQFVTDRGHAEFSPIKNTMVEILYAASYASERFRGFFCPAFNHRKKMSRFSLEPNGINSFSIQTLPKQILNSRSELSYVNPAKLNGGESLIGVYEMEVVLFNSKTRETFGQFSSVKNRIVVESEEEINLPECVGVKQENDSSTPGSRPGFHFGH